MREKKYAEKHWKWGIEAVRTEYVNLYLLILREIKKRNYGIENLLSISRSWIRELFNRRFEPTPRNSKKERKEI